jgi:crotonobetainyl-CoA:carnitine CoA-transferase CaiB-like acyl-CoA transferase
VQAEAFISRFGTIGPDKTLVLDVKAYETSLSDWDEALERARAANLPAEPAITPDQVLEETQVSLEAQPSTGQKDFDGLGA